MRALVLCTHCSRHVRQDDALCPFCDAPVTATAHAPTRGRLGRAARMAIGAATLAGCSGTTTGETDAAAKDAATETAVSDTANTATDAGVDTALPPEDSIAKPYGAPPADGLLV